MGGLTEGEPLALLRVSSWRFSVPLRNVGRILSAAMPVAIPDPASREQGIASAVRLADRLVPVIYGAVLFGNEDVELRPDQKMVLISTAQGEVMLWVDAVEDIVPFAPLAVPNETMFGEETWAQEFTAGEPSHAVLDVDRLRGA